VVLSSFEKNQKFAPQIGLKDPVKYLKGVGPAKALALNSVGIETVEDLLYYIPRRYLDRSNITPISKLQVNSHATVMGGVHSFGIKRGRKTRFLVILKDETGFLSLIWFEGIRYVQNRFKENDLVVASGEVRFYDGLQIAHPEFEIVSRQTNAKEKGFDLIHTGRVIPIYPSTAELKKVYLDSRGLRRVLKPLLDKISLQIEETLPSYLVTEINLLPLWDALKNVHFPENLQMAEKARQRLAFDELFFLELSLAIRKNRLKKSEDGISFKPNWVLVKKLLKNLPFQLTEAQGKVLREITDDMTSPQVMNRLLQGDVGSGKTVVALISILIAVESDYQAAIMAPTEILAEQHFLTIHKMLESLGVKIALLTSSITGSERSKVLDQIQSGEAKVIIGTHALIEEKVKFFNLGMVIIDEQHRFGVLQRAKLRKKGIKPDVLVMTATPIPRTLALTLYGDLDVSTIDQMPPGRKEIKTTLWDDSSSSKLYQLVEEELNKGHQAYIVYPLVEESEILDLKAATESFEFLKKEIFPHRRLALLHGRIKSLEREAIMQDFRDGKYDILVCTTVIEVGLDIPNATVMIIEHAERFGLSQLHQLRGRIGRGGDQSYCILKADFPISQEAKKRLNALCSTNDGFKIAEWDLKLRGPGEFLGTRQHGLPKFKIADIISDLNLLYLARDWAFKIVKEDPTLSSKENACLKQNFLVKYRERQKLLDIG